MLELDTADESATLANMGFLSPRFFDANHWAAVIQLGSFSCVVDGNRHALNVGYLNRWQYPSLGDALRGLREWNGEGAPKRWTTAYLDHAMTVWP